MNTEKKRLCVLVSGTGTNLQAILDAIKNNELIGFEVSVVISNKKEAYALKRAESEGIANLFLNPKDFANNLDFDRKLIEIINTHEVDLIVLAGYTKILTDIFINSFPNKIINIHPALLPNFGGRGMYGERVHEAVLQSGVKESGCTVHFVTLEVDKGPIIVQKKVSVLPNDTVESLSKRILAEEHKSLVEAIKKVLSCSHYCESVSPKQ